MTQQKVYTVYGSADGVLGVYGSVKKAYKKARWYLEQSAEEVDKTYSQITRELKKLSFVSIAQKTNSEDWGHLQTADIELFYLNQ